MIPGTKLAVAAVSQRDVTVAWPRRSSGNRKVVRAICPNMFQAHNGQLPCGDQMSEVL